MRHHLGGEQVHIPSREIIREDTEAGTLAHPLYAAQYSPGAPDQRVPVSMRASAVSLPPPNAPRLRMKFFIEPIEV
jgi:hypothetical protein